MLKNIFFCGGAYGVPQDWGIQLDETKSCTIGFIVQLFM
jgi:hypothetical protein